MNTASRAPASISGCFYQARRSGPPLRVGVVLDDGDRAPAYARAVVLDLVQARYVSLAAVVHLPGTVAPPCGGPLFRAYRKLLDRRYTVATDPFAPALLGEILASVAAFDVSAIDGISTTPAADGMQRIAESKLDVLLDLTWNGAPRALAGATRRGLWRIHQGDSSRYLGSTLHFAELVAADTLTAVELRCAESASDADRLLTRVRFATTPFLSHRINRVAPLWGSTHCVIQKLWELHTNSGTERAPDAGTPHSAGLPASRKSGSPSNLAIGAWLARETAARVHRKMMRTPSTAHWKIAVRRSTVALCEDTSAAALASFRWHESPRGQFWADPFLFAEGDATWLFFEDMVHAQGRARISCASLTNRGDLQDVTVVLERPYHLSYPQVFAADGEVFMIPESAGSGAIELYRARRFPDDWTLETRLLDLKSVDTTVFRDGARWRMLTSPMVMDGHAPVTWLFSAERLTGPWSYDPAGPASTDASRARGAGNVFQRHGRFVRPSQDCGAAYGRALLFNEIESLEPAYREQTFARIGGGWLPGLAGVHTYNRVGNWEAIDGKFLVAQS